MVFELLKWKPVELLSALILKFKNISDHFNYPLICLGSLVTDKRLVSSPLFSFLRSKGGSAHAGQVCFIFKIFSANDMFWSRRISIRWRARDWGERLSCFENFQTLLSYYTDNRGKYLRKFIMLFHSFPWIWGNHDHVVMTGISGVILACERSCLKKICRGMEPCINHCVHS